MHFTITRKHGNLSLTPWRARTQAIRNIINYHFTATDTQLNSYLITNYKTGLVQICLDIIKNSNYYKNYDNQIIVKIPNDKLDNLATLISFGDPTVGLTGSKILLNAFERI